MEKHVKVLDIQEYAENQFKEVNLFRYYFQILFRLILGGILKKLYIYLQKIWVLIHLCFAFNS